MIQSKCYVKIHYFMLFLCVLKHKCVGDMSTTLTFTFLLISIFNLFLITADGVEMMEAQKYKTQIAEKTLWKLSK